MPGGARMSDRAGTSLNAQLADPLIVIDGITAGQWRYFRPSVPWPDRRPTSTTFTVLKDASGRLPFTGIACCQWCNHHHDEKVRPDGVQVDFNTVNSISKITDKVDVLSPDEFRALVQSQEMPLKKPCWVQSTPTIGPDLPAGIHHR